MNEDIKWLEGQPAPQSKYPAMLDEIKRTTVVNARMRGKWAILNTFTSQATARDLAYRLGRKHEDFEFTSRTVETDGDGVTAVVYARYTGDERK
jgi:ketosteroid isomerase-like protein